MLGEFFKANKDKLRNSKDLKLFIMIWLEKKLFLGFLENLWKMRCLEDTSGTKTLCDFSYKLKNKYLSRKHTLNYTSVMGMRPSKIFLERPVKCRSTYLLGRTYIKLRKITDLVTKYCLLRKHLQRIELAVELLSRKRSSKGRIPFYLLE